MELNVHLEKNKEENRLEMQKKKKKIVARNILQYKKWWLFEKKMSDINMVFLSQWKFPPSLIHFTNTNAHTGVSPFLSSCPPRQHPFVVLSLLHFDIWEPLTNVVRQSTALSSPRSINICHYCRNQCFACILDWVHLIREATRPHTHYWNGAKMGLVCCTVCAWVWVRLS